MQRFTVFVVVPLAIVLGINVGLVAANMHVPEQQISNVIGMFFALWMTMVVLEWVVNFVLETVPRAFTDFVRIFRESSVQDEHGNVEIPLDRDGQVWGKVVIFNPPRPRSKSRPAYIEKKIARWAIDIRDRFGRKPDQEVDE